jgi:hypothetical protein
MTAWTKVAIPVAVVATRFRCAMHLHLLQHFQDSERC